MAKQSLYGKKKCKVIQPPAINIQTSKGVYGRVCITPKRQKAWLDVPLGIKVAKRRKVWLKFCRKVREKCHLKRDNDRLDLSLRNSIITLQKKTSMPTTVVGSLMPSTNKTQ